MLINSMKVFLEKDRSFSNNEELIKAFCKEYRDADFRKAKRVLKKLEDQKMRKKVDG
jgi:tRNA A-37 threonylcarbamoyl transferase component Bud32